MDVRDRAFTGHWQLTTGNWFSLLHHDPQRKLLPLHELRQHQRVQLRIRL